MLTDQDTAMLAFEAQQWTYAGAKEAAIRETFELSSTRYYQALNHLIDRPEAASHAPVLVARLHRLRDARRHQRAAARLGVAR